MHTLRFLSFEPVYWTFKFDMISVHNGSLLNESICIKANTSDDAEKIFQQLVDNTEKSDIWKVFACKPEKAAHYPHGWPNITCVMNPKCVVPGTTLVDLLHYSQCLMLP